MPTTIFAMQVVDETLIVEAGQRLAAAAPDAQVILFGSHTRGEASPRSDIDFLVVEPEVDSEAEESVRWLALCATCACRLTSSSLAVSTPTAGVMCAEGLSTLLSRRVGFWPNEHCTAISEVEHGYREMIEAWKRQ
jgi:hypothetical protein